MERRHFLKTIPFLPTAAKAMNLNELNAKTSSLKNGNKMPVLFIGHGSPMNGIEDNAFSESWVALAKEIPLPKAVLCVSAHWLTQGTAVTAMEKPETIHDFGGFPKELFDVRYPAPGSPAMAEETRRAVKSAPVALDHEWGLDHGAWTVIRRMYPDADVPVLQLSIDYHKPPQYHYNLGKELASLREKGVLILGSGNMVHNLRMIAFDRINDPEFGFDWALEMKAVFAKLIHERNHKALIDYPGLGAAAKLAIPTPDHYYPLLYALGLQEKGETATLFNDKAVAGSLTMTSVKIA
ncbi:MAG: Extradiol ring-cleavage dioxygenase class protein subunit [Fibrobacteres bacterium]|nr:Extradiol ring-cleavage dioxygenase class protein subunit [Fibrobacterota bacterium]